MKEKENEDLLSDFDKYRQSEDGSYSNMEDDELESDESDEDVVEEEELNTMLKKDFPLSGGEPDITFFELGDDENGKKED